MKKQTNNKSIFILMPNVNQEDDLKDRFDDLKSQLDLELDHKKSQDKKWEYQIFSESFDSMSELIDLLRISDPEIFQKKY